MINRYIIGIKLLITIGAGFIGSNLWEYFIAQGNQVVFLDNFATGHKHNLDFVIDHQNFKLIEEDMPDLKTCNQAYVGGDNVLPSGFRICSSSHKRSNYLK